MNHSDEKTNCIFEIYTQKKEWGVYKIVYLLLTTYIEAL